MAKNNCIRIQHLIAPGGKSTDLLCGESQLVVSIPKDALDAHGNKASDAGVTYKAMDLKEFKFELALINATGHACEDCKGLYFAEPSISTL